MIESGIVGIMNGYCMLWNQTQPGFQNIYAFNELLLISIYL